MRVFRILAAALTASFIVSCELFSAAYHTPLSVAESALHAARFGTLTKFKRHLNEAEQQKWNIARFEKLKKSLDRYETFESNLELIKENYSETDKEFSPKRLQSRIYSVALMTKDEKETAKKTNLSATVVCDLRPFQRREVFDSDAVVTRGLDMEIDPKEQDLESPSYPTFIKQNCLISKVSGV